MSRSRNNNKNKKQKKEKASDKNKIAYWTRLIILFIVFQFNYSLVWN